MSTMKSIMSLPLKYGLNLCLKKPSTCIRFLTSPIPCSSKEVSETVDNNVFLCFNDTEKLLLDTPYFEHRLKKEMCGDEKVISDVKLISRGKLDSAFLMIISFL